MPTKSEVLTTIMVTRHTSQRKINMIKIRDLNYKYPREDNFALEGINLEIKQGEKVAIIGHNGSGKSTLAKALIGLVKPASGIIRINDLELNHKNLLEIRSFAGMVFQNPNSQIIGSTVEEDLSFGLLSKVKSREEAKAIVDDITSKLGLTDKLSSNPRSLSGGQKQRVAIGAIMALNPKVLILDEVTSMLDTKSKNEVLSLIEKLHKDSKQTVISVTHNMDEAALADRVIVLSKGKIIKDGKPSEVLFDFVNNQDDNLSFEYEVCSKLGIKPSKNMDEIVVQLCK